MHSPFATLELLVDNAVLPSRAIGPEHYVATSFAADSTYFKSESETNSYGETYEQSWPVTPFKVRCALTEQGLEQIKHAYCEIYIDGKRAAKVFLKRGRPEHTFLGWQNNINECSASRDSCTEFLFSLPRPQPMAQGAAAAVPPPPNPDLGTVRCVLTRCKTRAGSTSRKRGRHDSGGVKVTAIGKKAAKSARVSTAAASGKTLGALATGYKTRKVDRLEVVSTLTLHYCTKEAIDLKLGLGAAAVGGRGAAAGPSGPATARQKPARRSKNDLKSETIIILD